ncbi:MAG: ATP synthase F1 subunit delta [Parcubacteria group bacterium]|nr:ATP synthase F1 subunit delta [Parcubacteria group bacterium]
MKRSEKQLAEAFVLAVDGKSDGDVSQAAADLVALLVERKEVHRLRGVIDAIEQVWAQRYGAATISVTTAHPLSDALRKKLQAVAKGAEIRESVDPEIIGGARLRIDEQIIDGSIKGHLEQLEAKLQSS